MVFTQDTAVGGPTLRRAARAEGAARPAVRSETRGQRAGAVQRRGERTFQSGAQMLAERVPATRRCSGTWSASPCRPEPTGGGALAASSTRIAPRPMGGESTELAPPPVLSAPRLASVGPSVASAASQSSAVAAAGGAASTAACPSSTKAEGAERFRGLWEDEMFARQGYSMLHNSAVVASPAVHLHRHLKTLCPVTPPVPED